MLDENVAYDDGVKVYRPSLNPAFLAKIRERRALEAQLAKEQRQAELIERMEREAQAERRLRSVLSELRARIGGTDDKLLRILEATATKHGVKSAEIVGPSVQRHVVAARYEAILAMHKACPEASPAQIGRIVNRDRTTVIHALKRTRKRTPA